MQSRLHFRIHAVQTELRAKMKAIQKGPLPVGDEMENDLDQIMPLDNSEETNHGTNFEIPKTEENATKLQARRII